MVSYFYYVQYLQNHLSIKSYVLQNNKPNQIFIKSAKCFFNKDEENTEKEFF